LFQKPTSTNCKVLEAHSTLVLKDFIEDRIGYLPIMGSSYLTVAFEFGCQFLTCTIKGNHSLARGLKFAGAYGAGALPINRQKV
jgi:hypothetical protein